MELKKLLNKYKKIGVMIIVILVFGGGWLYKNTHQVNNEDVFKDIEVSEPNMKKKIAQEKNDNQGLKNKTKITVDLTGAVLKEGVYQLNVEARVNDLINRAGGLANNADLKQVNRAQKLKDQDKIYIPFKGEVIDATNNQSTSNLKVNEEGNSNLQNSNTEGKINLNTATEADLMKLNGIGAKKAEQIITFRDENGPFKSPKDITKVSGIGEKTFENLQDQITV